MLTPAKTDYGTSVRPGNLPKQTTSRRTAMLYGELHSDHVRNLSIGSTSSAITLQQSLVNRLDTQQIGHHQSRKSAQGHREHVNQRA